MNKRFIIIAIVAVLAVIGFFIFTEPEEQTTGTPTNHQYSQGSSGIVLMEYGDFECPGCREYFPIIQQIKEVYKDTVTFQFRHLPLESLHVNARAAARAAEAASIQGKFWEMHDQLFSTQDSWKSAGDPLSVFASFAEQLGLNVDQFKSDYVSSSVNAAINADLAEFNKTGEPKSTPTFFLDGKMIEPNGGEGIIKQLNDALTAKGITPPELPTTNDPATQTVPEGTGSTEETPQQ